MQEIIEKLNKLKTAVNSLEKWERSGSMTLVNRDAHYQALNSVKQHIIKYVKSLVDGMKNEDVRKIEIAGRMLIIRKLMQDMYSGTITQGTEIIHAFDRITIPSLAGQVQSLLELYDTNEAKEQTNESVIDKLKPFAEMSEGGLASQLISILQGEKPKEKTKEELDEAASKEIQSLITEANEITEYAKRNAGSVDPREEIERLKQRVKEMLHRVESLVSGSAPTSRSDDMLHGTLHEMQVKHDLLVDRVQQELNILEDKVAEIKERNGIPLEKPTGKTITIRID